MRALLLLLSLLAGSAPVWMMSSVLVGVPKSPVGGLSKVYSYAESGMESAVSTRQTASRVERYFFI